MVQKQYKQSIISLKLNFFIGYNTYIFEIILLKSQFQLDCYNYFDSPKLVNNIGLYFNRIDENDCQISNK